MPKYGTQNPPPSLSAAGYPANQVVVFSAEALVAGSLSQQVCLLPNPFGGPPSVRVVIDFSADPGNVEIDVVESDSDVLGANGYQQVPLNGALTQASKTTGPNGANTRLSADYSPLQGPFIALSVKTVPSNSNITVTARITKTS